MGMKILTELFSLLRKGSGRTRGHGVTLAKKQCRLYIITLSFSQRTVNEWNRLSGDIIRRHNLCFHLYADDTQLYIKFEMTEINRLLSLRRIELCLSDVRAWMGDN